MLRLPHVNIYKESVHGIAVGLLLFVMCMICGCSSERFLSDDQYLLAKVKIETDNPRADVGRLATSIRQKPNARWFNFIKAPLGIYCLQGSDSTKRINRFFRRMGEAPVVYDERLKNLSLGSMLAAMHSRGYLHATVAADTLTKGYKTRLTYRVSPGSRTYIDQIERRYDSPEVERLVSAHDSASLLYRGMPLDVSTLSAERSRVAAILADAGFYNTHREYISFSVDTAIGARTATLTMHTAIPTGADSTKAYRVYRLGEVRIHENTPTDTASLDTYFSDLKMSYAPPSPRLHRRVYQNHINIRPDSLYRASDMASTYASLGSLSAVGYTTVRYTPTDSDRLVCDILVGTVRPHSVSMEVEGTNTAGNLGAALSLGYANRNLFHGSEELSLKLRGAYEAITGLEGYNNQNYIEYSAQLGLKFPSLIVPFVPRAVRHTPGATSEASVMYSSQDRPEFHRRVLTAAWTYRLGRQATSRHIHRIDLLNVNYVFMPWISDTFRKDYLEGDDPHYAVLRYSYENLLIAGSSYTYTFHTRPSAAQIGLNGGGSQVRVGLESAGALLRLLSPAFGAHQGSNGSYNLFGIDFSQYVKFDVDFSTSLPMGDVSSLAFHAAAGVAVPYGNSSIVPYEKRYFAGGANSVRGWGVRELGPGSYAGSDGKIDFINQTGNLKLDLSVEFRTRLFQKLHGAVFVDAGNVWNLRHYADQPGGEFKFDKFYRQIAVAYGLGLRLNMDYFVLRIDGGMKAINPAVPSGRDHWPIIHPKFSRDFAFHFAVGLPF